MRPRFVILVVLAALCGLLVVAHEESPAQPTAGVAGPLSWPAQSAGSSIQPLTIVHLNDLHASYQPRRYGNQSYSPLSLIRGYYVAVRGENPYTLFVSAGDELEKGSLADLLSYGESTIEVYGKLGLHLRAIGNHDFAYSLPGVLRLATEPGDVTLCANQRYPADPEGWARPYVEFTIGALKVGAFSMVGKPWDDANQQFTGPYYPEIEARYDYVAVAREIVSRLRNRVDLVLFISHLGRKLDRKIAEAVPGIDVIVGGHDHRGPKPHEFTESGTIIVQAKAYGKAVGRLDMTVDLRVREIIEHQHMLTEVHPRNMMPDIQLENAIRDALERYAPHAATKAWQVTADLAPHVSTRLAAEAALEVLETDAALFDVRTARAVIRRGVRSRQDLLDVFRVEFERAGTNGFSSVHITRVSGHVLSALDVASSGRFVYLGPRPVDPTALYTLAIQKHAARRSKEYFGVGIPRTRMMMETWELLARYAEMRAARGLPLDEP